MTGVLRRFVRSSVAAATFLAHAGGRARPHGHARTAVLGACAVLAGCLGLSPAERLNERLWIADARHRHSELEPLARRIYEIERKNGDDSPQALASLLTIAHMISRSGRPEESLRAGERALAQYERVYGRDDYRTALAVRSLGDFLCDASRPADAERTYDRAVRMCLDAPGEVRAALSVGHDCGAWSNVSLSNGYQRLGRYEKAEPLVISFRTRASRFSTTQSCVGDLAGLGDFHFEYGNYPKALWYYHACENLWGRVQHEASKAKTPIYRSRGVEVALGNGAHAFSSIAPSCVENLIEATGRAGDEARAATLREQERAAWNGADTDVAEHDLLRSIALMSANDSFAPISLAYEHEALGFLYNRKQRYGEATPAFERAHEIQQKNWDLLSEAERYSAARARLDSLLMRGDNAAAAGNVAMAEQSYAAFVELAGRYLNGRHRWRFEGFARLGSLYAQHGRYDDALAAWQRFLEQAASSRGGEDLDTAWGLTQQAAVYRAMGRARDAQRATSRALRIRAQRVPEIAAVRDLPMPASSPSNAAVTMTRP